MNSPIFDRKRTGRFAKLLDEAAGRRPRHRRTEHDQDLDGLVRLCGQMTELPGAAEPDPDFRAGLRDKLMETIAREGIGVTAEQRAADTANRAALAARTQVIRPVPGGHGRTRAALLVGVIAGALAVSGVSAASTRSIPGDPLYQVKRSTERAQLALATSDLARGKMHLDFAYSRLSEATRLPPERAEPVLADMDREALLGSRLIIGWAVDRKDPTVLDIVDDFMAKLRSRLARLDPGYPTAASVGVVDQISQRSQQLRQSIRG